MENKNAPRPSIHTIMWHIITDVVLQWRTYTIIITTHTQCANTSELRIQMNFKRSRKYLPWLSELMFCSRINATYVNIYFQMAKGWQSGAVKKLMSNLDSVMIYKDSIPSVVCIKEFINVPHLVSISANGPPEQTYFKLVLTKIILLSRLHCPSLTSTKQTILLLFMKWRENKRAPFHHENNKCLR